MFFVRLFNLCLFGFVFFLFLLVSGKGCGLVNGVHSNDTNLQPSEVIVFCVVSLFFFFFFFFFFFLFFFCSMTEDS